MGRVGWSVAMVFSWVAKVDFMALTGGHYSIQSTTRRSSYQR
jgi:hypothetical protein